MQPLDVHPSKTLVRPGAAVHAARDAAATAEVDVGAALARRDFMVSEYSDAGQERWLPDNGIELLRGTGRLAGPGVVDGVKHRLETVGIDPKGHGIPVDAHLRAAERGWVVGDVTGCRDSPTPIRRRRPVRRR